MTIDSDYRFEKKDELHIDRAQRPLRVCVTDLRAHVTDSGSLSRDILALKL